MASHPEYAASAEFLHVLSLPMWAALRGQLAGALAGVNGKLGPVVEFGAGTGLGTQVVLDTVDAEVWATEPSAPLRAVLLARMAERPDTQRVTVYPAGAAEVSLPDRVTGAVGMNMIGHVHPDQRRALWASLAARLAPGSPVVVNVQPPDAAVAVPLTSPFAISVGRLTYQARGRAEPTGPESLRWQMRYRVFDGDELLRETTAEYDWWVLSATGLADELRTAGLTASVNEDLVVARS